MISNGSNDSPQNSVSRTTRRGAAWSANRIPTVLPHSAPEITRQSQPAKFRFPDHEMERPEPRVRLCQIERGGGKLVAEGDVRAVAPLMKVLDWLDRRKRSPGPFPADAPEPPWQALCLRRPGAA